MGKERKRRPIDIAHAAARGTIAAMAMTGARTVTQNLGLVPKSPPEAMVERSAGKRMAGRTGHRTREVVIQATHWAYGAFGGAVFGSLPDDVRRRDWAGPIYGVVLWLAFETAIAPLLRLHREAKTPERLALFADHLIYGLVLSEIRRRPQR